MGGYEADWDGGVGEVGAHGDGWVGAGGVTAEALQGFQAAFNRRIAKGPGGIPFGDVLIPGLAMLCTGKSDFEAVRALQGTSWAKEALQVSRLASPETLRQNLDQLSDGFLPICRETIAGLDPSGGGS